MAPDLSRPCRAFAGTTQIASGSLVEVATRAKAFVDEDSLAPLLVFDDETGAAIDLDLRGSPDEALARLGTPLAHRPGNRSFPKWPTESAGTGAREDSASPSRGRPRLGVVGREVTLLPRHWSWLNEQPGGASAVLRRLVEEARRADSGKNQARTLREYAYRFMSAIAGDLPGFEEATRALFAGNAEAFDQHISDWPPDVRAHAQRMATRSFENAAG
jgi:uncharacterized protein